MRPIGTEQLISMDPRLFLPTGFYCILLLIFSWVSHLFPFSLPPPPLPDPAYYSGNPIYYRLDAAYCLMGFPLLPLEISLIDHRFPLVHLRILHICGSFQLYFTWNPDYSSGDSCLIFSGSCLFLMRFLLFLTAVC